MENLTEIKEYGTFKQALGTELKVVANGFVRIGYLLKVARDTDILRESGYKTVAEFAQAEYGLTKDVVSRYIAINDRWMAIQTNFRKSIRILAWPSWARCLHFQIT